MPGSVNPESHAVGLIQFMPSTLEKLGYPGSWRDFAELSATEQMDYVRKFLLPGKGTFTSAGRIYQFMFLPSTMDSSKARGGVIATVDDADERLKKAYAKNSGLDANKDGTITIDELEARARQHRAAAQHLLGALRARPRPRPAAEGTP